MQAIRIKQKIDARARAKELTLRFVQISLGGFVTD